MLASMNRYLKPILFLLISIFILQCSGKGSKQENRDPNFDKTSDPITHEEKAAVRLIEKSQIYLQEGNTDLAIKKLEDAIRISPYYGPSYYYLAEIEKDVNNLDYANRLLDKAEILLQNDAEWMTKVWELRDQIENSSTSNY
jgi:tetratricopeptide (TPR) repeat protein